MNCYEILNAEFNYTDEQIKDAYHKKIKQHHRKSLIMNHKTSMTLSEKQKFENKDQEDYNNIIEFYQIRNSNIYMI